VVASADIHGACHPTELQVSWHVALAEIDASWRTKDSGSSAEERLEPTRTASAPNEPTREIVIDEMPLSTTAIMPTGTFGRRRSLVVGSIDSVFQVAVVDSDDLGSGIEGSFATPFPSRTSTKGLKLELNRCIDHHLQAPRVRARTIRRGSVAPWARASAELERVDVKVLFEDRKFQVADHGIEILKRSIEVGRLGENRDRGRAPSA